MARRKLTPEEVLLARLQEVPKGKRAQFARIAGISQWHLWRWLHGEAPVDPRLQTLKRLASAFGLTLDELLSEMSQNGKTNGGPPRGDA